VSFEYQHQPVVYMVNDSSSFSCWCKRAHLLQLSCRLEHRYSSTGLPQGDSGSEAANACAHNAHMNTLTHFALSLLALYYPRMEWSKPPLFFVGFVFAMIKVEECRILQKRLMIEQS
jgi:hypothetical protein